MEIVRGYVRTAHGLVHYRATEPSATPRPQLLLLHQTASSSVMYEALIELLDGAFDVFAPDTPGFGGSPAPRGPATMALYARALHEACTTFGFASPFVLGHHTGASIAVQIEANHPGFARKMLLSGPPYLTPAQKSAMRAKTKRIVLDPDGKHLREVWQRLRAKDPDAPLDLVHREAVLTLQAGVRYHEAYDAVFAHDFESQLAAVRCPVLVMAGDEDTLSSSLDPAFAALEHGEKRRIERGTTYVVDREPALVARIAVDFFSRESTARR